MNRIEQILSNARRTLADKHAERWSDDDLRSLLDEAQKDFCRHTKILTDRVNLPVVNGVADISLPVECWQVTRAAFGSKALPILSHADMDHLSGYGNWYLDTGLPKSIIYDRANVANTRLYPTPNETVADYWLELTQEESSGVLTDLPPINVVPGIGVSTSSDTVLIDQGFGVTTGVGAVTVGYLTFWYIKMPADLTEQSFDLETPRMFDVALKYYVIGHAFLNDIDTEYQAKGMQQLKLYQRELDLAKKSSSLSNTRAAQYDVGYRSAFS